MCNMCISVFLAQVIGTYLFLVSLAMLAHQHRFKKITTDLLGNPPLLTFTGLIGIILGLLIVCVHNAWVSDWPLLITLIGWIVLLQGISRLLFPGTYSKMVKELLNDTGYLIWSWFWLLIGIYLMWVGFTA